MSVTQSFFGKRESNSYTTRSAVGGSNASTVATDAALRSGQGLPAHAAQPPVGASASAEAPVATANTPAPTVAEGAAPNVSAAGIASPAPGGTTSTGGSQLTVGPNIKLKGVEITDCDTLVVEGTVEATMDSRVIHIAKQGAFHGAAEIDIAEIFGQFTGNLTVRERLVIHSTGRVSGKIRYGKVVIEEGGQLSGEIEAGIAPAASAVAASSKKEVAPKAVAMAA